MFCAKEINAFVEFCKAVSKSMTDPVKDENSSTATSFEVSDHYVANDWWLWPGIVIFIFR